MSRQVLFSDFDGTLTDVEFYDFAMKRLGSGPCEDVRAAFSEGHISVFELQRRIFAAITLSEERVLELLPELQPDAFLVDDFDRLAAAGWDLHVISAGSTWFIERLFRAVGVGVPVTIHANPGEFIDGRGLILSLPEDARVARADIGIDKAEVVRLHSEQADRIAYAGNSWVDLAGARLSTDGYCFALEPLDRLLAEEGRGYHLIERFHEVANALLATESD